MTEKQSKVSTDELYGKAVVAINKVTKAYHKALKDGSWYQWKKKVYHAKAARKALNSRLYQTGEDNRRYHV